jgi:tRNA modification GTPase
MHYSDTIYALSSGFGKAGVAVVRLSGVHVRSVLQAIAGKVPANRVATLKTLRDKQGNLLDQALVLYFENPHSFTGEDVAEFHIHGGRASVAALLTCLSQFDGTRLAEPGEFSRRAFLGGKMGLDEIEALGDLIDSDTDAQRRQALNGFKGGLRKRVEEWRQILLEALSWVEAEIDFPDEEEAPTALHPDVVRNIEHVIREARRMLEDGRRGERLRQGAVVTIMGPPNAGKSSFLNKVADRQVAIVSAQAGTTRDAIEVALDLNGFPVTLVDTAGLRETTEDVESQGIALTQKWAEASDLVLWFVEDQDRMPYPSGLQKKTVWKVHTKNDLNKPIMESDAKAYSISALTGDGINQLMDDLAQWAKNEFESGEEPFITRERHRLIVSQLYCDLDKVLSRINELPRELLAEELRIACRLIGRVAGRVDVEDVLDTIFSAFCIGK